MDTLLPGNGSYPSAVSWTPVWLWRPPQPLLGLQNGRGNGTALKARQPGGEREASPPEECLATSGQDQPWAVGTEPSMKR